MCAHIILGLRSRLRCSFVLFASLPRFRGTGNRTKKANRIPPSRGTPRVRSGSRAGLRAVVSLEVSGTVDLCACAYFRPPYVDAHSLFRCCRVYCALLPCHEDADENVGAIVVLSAAALAGFFSFPVGSSVAT